MAQAIRVQVDLSDLLPRLQSVDQKTRKTVLQKAAKVAGKIAKDEIKSRAPRSTLKSAPQLTPGLLRLSIADRVKSYRSGVIVLLIGPRTKSVRDKKLGARKLTGFGRMAARRALKRKIRSVKAEKQAPAHYAHLAGPGRKQHFMTDAAEAAVVRAREPVLEVLRQGVEEAWRR